MDSLRIVQCVGYMCVEVLNSPDQNPILMGHVPCYKACALLGPPVRLCVPVLCSPVAWKLGTMYSLVRCCGASCEADPFLCGHGAWELQTSVNSRWK